MQGSKRLNVVPELTKVNHGHGLAPAEVSPSRGATSCAMVCAPITECAGFAVDFVQNRCVFYWKEDVDVGGIVEQEGYALYF